MQLLSYFDHLVKTSSEYLSGKYENNNMPIHMTNLEDQQKTIFLIKFEKLIG